LPKGSKSGSRAGERGCSGDAYSLADVEWYSMVPGMPHMVPEICNPQATPGVAAWLAGPTLPTPAVFGVLAPRRPAVDRRAPALGADTEQVLSALGIG